MPLPVSGNGSVPIWRQSAFAGQFGDAFIKNTQLEGGQIGPAVKTLLELTRPVVDKAEDMVGFQDSDKPALNKVLDSLQQLADIDDLLGKIKGTSSGIEYTEWAGLVKQFSDMAKNLQVGERMVYPGGWTNTNPARNHAVVMIFERTTDDKFAVVTCNTGGGVEYHPVTAKDYPKSKMQCALRIGDIPEATACDESLWYMILKLQLFACEENSRSFWYEVIIPHLTAGNPEEAIKHWEPTGGHYETPQRSGTCFYRCTLTAFRYLLKEYGFTVEQQKELFVNVRLSFLRKAEAEMKQCGAGDMNQSDTRLVRLAIQMSGLAAAKMQKRGVYDAQKLKEIHGYLAEIRTLTDSVAPADQVGGPEKQFELSASAELVQLPGLGSVVQQADVTPYKGQDTQVAPDLFVNMLKIESKDSGKDHYAHVAAVISNCLTCCKKIRDKAAVSSASIALHQVCALVERTFSVDIPIPDPATGFKSDGMMLEQQRASIRELLDISMQYVSACKSKNSDRGMDAAHAITMGAILTVADAIARIEAADQPSPLFQVLSGRADSMLYLARDPSVADPAAPEEALTCPQGHSLKEEPHDSHWCDLCSAGQNRKMGTAYRCSEGCDFDVCKKCFDNKGKQLPPLDGYSLCFQSYAGFSLESMSGSMLIHSKELCSTRNAVIRYQASFGKSSKPALMSDLQYQPNKPGWSFVGNADETTFKFVATLIKVCGVENELPAVNLSLSYAQRGSGGYQQLARDPGMCSDAERLGRWFASTWDGKCPEMAHLRDIVFLHKIMMEPSGLLANHGKNKKWPSLWFTSHARPLFNFVRADGNVAAVRVTLAEQQISAGLVHPESPADPKNYIKTDSLTVTEDDVLYETQLELFDNSLTPEEGELLLSFLTVPYLSIQLLLNFFAHDRAGLLIQPQLQKVLESAIFEPKHHCAAEAMPVLQVPIPANERATTLATPFGLLHHELSHSADSLLDPLTLLCSGVVQLCTGNFDSRFVPVLLFMLRIVTRIKSFAAEHWPEGDGKLSHFLQNQAPRLLRFWIGQAEQIEATAQAVQFHSHLALLYGATSTMDPESLRLFVCSVAYVVSWHSEPTVEKTAGEGPEEEEDLFAMLTGAGAAADPNAEPYPGDGVVNAVLTLYEARRQQVVEWAGGCESGELDLVLSQIVGVALQGGMPADRADLACSSTRGWDLISSRPLNCVRSVESPHPYPSNWQQRDELHFPGVEYMSLFFDSRTTTEVLCDCVTVYTEDRRGHLVPVPGGEKISGINWPGKDGRPPLVIGSDRVFIEFSSDASNEDWGFKVTAYAPVSQSIALQLSETLEIPLKAAQVALQACGNSVDDAKAGLEDGRLSKEEPGETVAAGSNTMKGIYQDPDGALQVNLQTAEVCVRGRMRIPVPATISNDPDFQAVLTNTGKKPDGLYLSLIHISEPTRLLSISYAVFCLKKKKKKILQNKEPIKSIQDILERTLI
eukprot:TRINITY_DN13891_c0_g1_i1.p1 TRINITY_DN13891_c0_g1~~TRINITY_DN13891_c0_g1_i1.p1  ORF type:complete len:1462 (-),score=417.56 TRINITY_DN13891_c0_g1_i1:67-4452(-)